MKIIIAFALLLTPVLAANKHSKTTVPFKIERSKKDYSRNSEIFSSQPIRAFHPIGGPARQFTNRPKFDR